MSASVRNYITLNYLRAHAGFKGNEEADSLADWQNFANHNVLPCTKKEVALKVKGYLSMWRKKQLLKLEREGSETTLWYQRTTGFSPTNPLLAPTLSGINYRVLRIIGQLRTGHCYLVDRWKDRMGYYRSLSENDRGRWRSGNCSFCHTEDGSVEHLLLQCRIFASDRKACKDFTDSPSLLSDLDASLDLVSRMVSRIQKQFPHLLTITGAKSFRSNIQVPYRVINDDLV